MLVLYISILLLSISLQHHSVDLEAKMLMAAGSIGAFATCPSLGAGPKGPTSAARPSAEG